VCSISPDVDGGDVQERRGSSNPRRNTAMQCILQAENIEQASDMGASAEYNNKNVIYHLHVPALFHPTPHEQHVPQIPSMRFPTPRATKDP